jgi:phage-related minor tail protein
MAGKIRGITIQINGDTKGLNKALAEVNKESKSLQIELKQVEKALKLDPTNTQLLRQKQTLLAQSVEVTRTKLDALRQAQEQMAKANAANANWEKAYQPLKAKIDETNAALKKLTAQEAEMKAQLDSGKISTEQYDNLQKELDGTSQKSKDLAKELRDLEKQFADGHISDEEYRKFQRELAKTSKELEGLEKQAAKSNVSIAKISETCDRVGSKLTTAGKNMTMGVTAPLAAAGAAAFKLASDFDESLNKVGEVFKENAADVEAWSEDSLRRMGLAQGSALDMAASFGDLGTSMGQSSAEAAFQSKQLTQLAADMASFKNISVDRAQNALTAVYTGETESLKMLGVVMTQANLKQYAMANGWNKNLNEMTQLELVQLRYNYVMDATKNAQGDFQRTSDGAANSTRIFMESLKELGEKFGQEILPILTPIIQALTNLITKFSEMDQGTKAFIVRLLMLVATLGPVLMMVGAVFNAISSISNGIGALGGVAGKFAEGAGNTTYLTFLKWAAIIAGIVLLITALIAAISVLTGKGEQMSRTFESMGSAVGGGGSGYPTAKIPGYASGTKFHPGGLALVGEQGAELLELPRGTRVYNHNDSKRMIGEQGSSSGETFQITVNVESLEDIQQLMKLARDARRMERMGKVRA